MFLSELPPSSTASLANCFHFAAFSLSITPLSPFITSTKHLSNSSLVAIPFSPAITRIPTSQTSTRYFALVGWSVHCGMATTGTPRLSASSVEFHPQREIAREFALLRGPDHPQEFAFALDQALSNFTHLLVLQVG
nr:hypothetical protein CFOL_v3_34014 [Ipomoea trifida]